MPAVYEAMKRAAGIGDAIQHIKGGYDVVPANIMLAGAGAFPDREGAPAEGGCFNECAEVLQPWDEDTGHPGGGWD